MVRRRKHSQKPDFNPGVLIMMMISVNKFTPVSLMGPQRKEAIRFLKIDLFGEMGLERREKKRTIKKGKQIS